MAYTVVSATPAATRARRFDFDAMLDLAGNTAVFLLYMHARIASIQTKAMARARPDGARAPDMAELVRSATLTLAHDKEARPAQPMTQGPDCWLLHSGGFCCTG